MGALFFVPGLGKVPNFTGFAGSLAAKGLPFPTVFAALAIFCELVGPVLLVLGVVPRLAALLLIAFTIVATATSHLFWLLPDPAAQAAQQIHFLKNVGLIGGLLFYFAAGPGRIALMPRG